jgi:hypothetical protein
MRAPLALLVAAATALAFAPATSTDGSGSPSTDEPAGYAHSDPDADVFFLESTAWFGPTTTRVSNVDHENDELIGWSDAEPTDPVGAATVSTFVDGFRGIVEDGARDNGQFTAAGTVTGYLDSMTLDLHFVGPFQEALCDLNVAVDLQVDDLPVLDMDDIGGLVPVQADPSGTGHVAKLKLTNITAKLESFSGTGLDFVGDETTEHAVRVVVHQFPICNEVVWRFGGADVPSRIVFNRDPSDPSVADHTTFDVLDPPTD